MSGTLQRTVNVYSPFYLVEKKQLQKLLMIHFKHSSKHPVT